MRCPDCDDSTREVSEIDARPAGRAPAPPERPVPQRDFDRRDFLKTSVLGGASLAATMVAPRLAAGAAPIPSLGEKSETLVATLYKSLSAEQRKVVAFPFDHPLRSKVDNNWRITPVNIGEFFTRDQQAMIEEIFRGLHNPEFVDKVMYHINEDAGGLGNYTVALFGEPGTNVAPGKGAFEFVLTGRHCTARCDGDSVEGQAFGGPIFYGHASQSFYEKADHPNNVYWYQAKRANEVFQALEGKQRALALRNAPRDEQGTATVALKSSSQGLEGLPVSEMTGDQRELVAQVLHDLLLPFRESDRLKALEDIKARGGFDALTMAFYKNLDIGNDGVWDVWQLESPTMVWYFRGAPHVHVWVNIRARG